MLFWEPTIVLHGLTPDGYPQTWNLVFYSIKRVIGSDQPHSCLFTLFGVAKNGTKNKQ